MAIEHAGEAQAPAKNPAKKGLHELAFGIERIGLVSLHFPFAAVCVAVLLAVAAGFGVARLKVDDSLSQLFRSDTPEFKQYEEVTWRFPSSEFDVLVVIEGKRLLARIGRTAEGSRRGPAADQWHARSHFDFLGPPAVAK